MLAYDNEYYRLPDSRNVDLESRFNKNVTLHEKTTHLRIGLNGRVFGVHSKNEWFRVVYLVDGVDSGVACSGFGSALGRPAPFSTSQNIVKIKKGFDRKVVVSLKIVGSCFIEKGAHILVEQLDVR